MPKNNISGRRSLTKEAKKLIPLIGIQGVGGGGATDHGTLLGLSDDDHSQYVHISSPRTITAQHSFSPSSTQAPFTLGANAQGQLVTGLNADQLDSLHASNNPGATAAVVATNASGYIQVARVGIGTSPSTNPLEVSGNASFSGDVAIGTTSTSGARLLVYEPTGSLDVYLRSEDDNALLRIQGGYDGGVEQSGVVLYNGTTTSWGIWKGTNNNLQFYDYTNTDYLLNIASDGSILWEPLSTGIFSIRKTSEQLRLEYSASYFSKFTVTSGGSLMLEPEGNILFDTGAAANHIDPVYNYKENLGQLSKKYLTLHAAELWVETLVAQDTIATIGGRILVGPTTKFSVELADTTTCTYQLDLTTANGGFETAGAGSPDIFADWTENFGDGDIFQGSTHRSGSYSCRLIAGATANTYLARNFTVTENTIYLWRFYHRSYAGDTSVGRYRVYDNIGGASIIAATEVDGVAGDDTNWYENAIIFTTPAGCTSVKLMFYCPLTDTDRAYFDDTYFTGGITITVEHNQMSPGDIAYAEADGHLEFFRILSDDVANGDYFDYLVERDLDGTGENTWYQGDALFNTGNIGDGFIDLYSYSGVTSGTVGPTIAGNIRNSITYYDWNTHWAIGNLNGLYGYGSSDTYGAAFGEYTTGQPWVSVDSTNGFRVNRYTTVLGQWDTSGNIYVGDQSAEHIVITSGSVTFKTGGSTDLMILNSTPAITIGEVGSSLSNIRITSGAIYLRNNTTSVITLQSDGDALFGRTKDDLDADQGNMFWDYSAGQLLFRGGTTTQAYIDTTGSITAGGGVLTLNSNGIQIAATTSQYDVRSYKFLDGSTVISGLYGYYGSGTNTLYLNQKSISANHGVLLIGSNAPTGYSANLDITASVSTYEAGFDSYCSTTQQYSRWYGELRVENGIYVGGIGTAVPAAGTITTTDYIVALGGLHVGGTSDPGTDILLVDSDARVGGGITVGSTSDYADAGYITYLGGLQSRPSATSYPVWAIGPLDTYTSIYSGTSRTSANDGTITIGGVGSIPGAVRGVFITGAISCATADVAVYFGTPGGSNNHVEVRTQAANRQMPFAGFVPCDSGGDIEATYQSGYTFTVYLRVSGYII